MRNLAKISVVAVVCVSAAAGAWAQGGPGSGPPRGDRFIPFVGMMAPKTPLYFGTASGLGPRRLKASTSVRVLANRPFAVAAVFEGLTLNGGPVTIPAQRITVTINDRKVPIGTERVRIASGGPTSVHGIEVPIVIEIEVKGAGFNPAGRYGGNLVLSIM